MTRGSWRHARMTESFRHAITLWLLDHAADQTNRIGDTLAGPWYRRGRTRTP